MVGLAKIFTLFTLFAPSAKIFSSLFSVEKQIIESQGTKLQQTTTKILGKQIPKNQIVQKIIDKLQQYSQQLTYASVATISGYQLINSIKNAYQLQQLDQQAIIYISPKRDTENYLQIVKAFTNLAVNNGGTIKMIFKDKNQVNLVTIDPDQQAIFKIIGKNFKNFKTDFTKNIDTLDFGINQNQRGIKSIVKKLLENKKEKPYISLVGQTRQQRLKNFMYGVNYQLQQKHNTIRRQDQIKDYLLKLFNIYQQQDEDKLQKQLNVFLKEYGFFKKPIQNWKQFSKNFYEGKLEQFPQLELMKLENFAKQLNNFKIDEKIKTTLKNLIFKRKKNDIQKRALQQLFTQYFPTIKEKPDFIRVKLYNLILQEQLNLVQINEMYEKQRNNLLKVEIENLKQISKKRQRINNFAENLPTLENNEQYGKLRLLVNLVEFNKLFMEMGQNILTPSVKFQDSGVALLKIMQKFQQVQWLKQRDQNIHQVVNTINQLNSSPNFFQQTIDYVTNKFFSQNKQFAQDIPEQRKRKFEQELSQLSYDYLKQRTTVENAAIWHSLFHWKFIAGAIGCSISLKFFVEKISQFFKPKQIKNAFLRGLKKQQAQQQLKTFAKQIEDFHPFLTNLKKAYLQLQQAKPQYQGYRFQEFSKARIDLIKRFAEETEIQYNKLVDFDFVIVNQLGERKIVNPLRVKKGFILSNSKLDKIYYKNQKRNQLEEQEKTNRKKQKVQRKKNQYLKKVEQQQKTKQRKREQQENLRKKVKLNQELKKPKIRNKQHYKYIFKKI